MWERKPLTTSSLRVKLKSLFEMSFFNNDNLIKVIGN